MAPTLRITFGYVARACKAPMATLLKMQKPQEVDSNMRPFTPAWCPGGLQYVNIIGKQEVTL